MASGGGGGVCYQLYEKHNSLFSLCLQIAGKVTRDACILVACLLVRFSI